MGAERELRVDGVEAVMETTSGFLELTGNPPISHRDEIAMRVLDQLVRRAPLTFVDMQLNSEVFAVTSYAVADAMIRESAKVTNLEPKAKGVKP